MSSSSSLSYALLFSLISIFSPTLLFGLTPFKISTSDCELSSLLFSLLEFLLALFLALLLSSLSLCSLSSRLWLTLSVGLGRSSLSLGIEFRFASSLLCLSIGLSATAGFESCFLSALSSKHVITTNVLTSSLIENGTTLFVRSLFAFLQIWLVSPDVHEHRDCSCSNCANCHQRQRCNVAVQSRHDDCAQVDPERKKVASAEPQICRDDDSRLHLVVCVPQKQKERRRHRQTSCNWLSVPDKHCDASNEQLCLADQDDERRCELDVDHSVRKLQVRKHQRCKWVIQQYRYYCDDQVHKVFCVVTLNRVSCIQGPRVRVEVSRKYFDEVCNDGEVGSAS